MQYSPLLTTPQEIRCLGEILFRGRFLVCIKPAPWAVLVLATVWIIHENTKLRGDIVAKSWAHITSSNGRKRLQ